MPNPVVAAKVNMSPVLSGVSDDGQPWSLCIWDRNFDGEQRLVIIDEKLDQNGGSALLNGIAYVGDGNNNDVKCEIKNNPVTDQDLGNWRCTLVSQNGTFSTCRRVSLQNGTLGDLNTDLLGI